MSEPLKRATIFLDHPGNTTPVEFDWVEKWLARWDGQVRVARYETGGWEHLWDVEGPEDAIKEVSPDLLCHSDWADSTP